MNISTNIGTWAARAILAVAVLGAAAAGQAATSSNYRSELEQARREADQQLRAPNGVLSVIGLLWRSTTPLVKSTAL
jgi:hypothetical protein